MQLTRDWLAQLEAEAVCLCVNCQLDLFLFATKFPDAPIVFVSFFGQRLSTIRRMCDSVERCVCDVFFTFIVQNNDIIDLWSHCMTLKTSCNFNRHSYTQIHPSIQPSIRSTCFKHSDKHKIMVT